MENNTNADKTSEKPVRFIDLIMQAFIYLFCLFLCGAAATVLQIWLLG